MKFTVKQIADILGGTVEGNADHLIDTLCKIEEGTPTGLSFLANPKYTAYLYDTQAGAVIVSADFVPERDFKTTLIRVDNPYSCFAKLLDMSAQIRHRKQGISPHAVIDSEATVQDDVYLGAFVVVEKGAIIEQGAQIYPHSYIGEDVVIGKNTILYAGVKIYERCKIGENCILHAGAVVGSDGFGFAPQEDTTLRKIPQIGNVEIENDVEIGANTTIDRATMGTTLIKKGVKIDNLCQVAHNCVIGENTGIAAHVGMAGSTKIGQRCRIGGQAGFSGHITIGNDVNIGAQAGVISNIPDQNSVIGAPAFNVKDFMRSSVYFKKLPLLAKKIEAIEQQLLHIASEQPHQKD